MTGLNITLNDDQMRAMLSEAMLRALDSGTREALIARALEYLVKPQSGPGYGDKLSPLESAFRDAVRSAATEEARRALTWTTRSRPRSRRCSRKRPSGCLWSSVRRP